MDARHLDPDADVLIAGAGPAGCAAAIVCAAAGLRTVLAERAPGPVARPGEALHPGAETSWPACCRRASRTPSAPGTTASPSAGATSRASSRSDGTRTGPGTATRWTAGGWTPCSWSGPGARAPTSASAAGCWNRYCGTER
ncbi:geranylgeranyl reductase family protein [Kitasatospora sp. Ki12]